MPRIGRIVVPGYPHHVVHRGNRGEAIFPTPDDRRLYCQWLREYATANGVRIWAYCLMTNHVHLVVVPEREESLALAVGQAHLRYSRWVNSKQGSRGHLWANRFYSAPMDEPHLWMAVKYAELNPVRAGLAAFAESYPWSSAAAHVRAVPDAVVSFDLPPGGPAVGPAWRDWLREGLQDAALASIRRCTNGGRPLGSRDFVTWVMTRREARPDGPAPA